ncbi:MAG: hypothetical protein MJE66_12140 [Proteobacteria bacterium]|nr:hypothetical protein [Pseudomonadota bacterium]
MSFDESVGSLGVAMLLVAFFANAFGYLPHASRRYHALNAVGAALACLASFLIDFVPFVVLEGTWCLVALVAFGRIGRDRAPVRLS